MVDDPAKGEFAIGVWANSWFCENLFDNFAGDQPPKDKQITAQDNGIRVEPGQSIKLTLDHKSGNAPPDRAHVELTITNRAQPA